MDGKISVPLIDEVQAAGLTPLQLKEVLIEKFKKFIDNPNISVIVIEANSFKVYITGQVRTPGVYRIRSETSLPQGIAMAGGFTDWANQKKILIIRKCHVFCNLEQILFFNTRCRILPKCSRQVPAHFLISQLANHDK
jgi:protein involved in polysaccharide export with SLBB domain